MILLKQPILLLMAMTSFTFAMNNDQLRADEFERNIRISEQQLQEQQRNLSRRYFHRYSESSGSEDDRPFHRDEKKYKKKSKY